MKSIIAKAPLASAHASSEIIRLESSNAVRSNPKIIQLPAGQGRRCGRACIGQASAQCKIIQQESVKIKHAKSIAIKDQF